MKTNQHKSTHDNVSTQNGRRQHGYHSIDKRLQDQKPKVFILYLYLYSMLGVYHLEHCIAFMDKTNYFT